jgi:hypothetical protein
MRPAENEGVPPLSLTLMIASHKLAEGQKKGRVCPAGLALDFRRLL